MSILATTETFVLEIQTASDWTHQLKVQKEAAEICGKCIEWLTPDHKNHEDFPLFVPTFFALLNESQARKVLPREDLEDFSKQAKEKIYSLEIEDEDLLEFLEHVVEKLNRYSDLKKY